MTSKFAQAWARSFVDVRQYVREIASFGLWVLSLPASIRLSVRPWYLVNLLVRIKEPSSPTGWQQSPQLQAEETKKSRKLDCVATGFVYDDAVNFTVDIRHQVCQRENSSPVQAGITKFGPLVKIPIVLRGDWP